MKKTKKYLKIGLGVFVTILFMWYAVKDISLYEILGKIKNANHISLIFILATTYVFFWIKALRWKFLLTPIGDFSVKEVAGPMMVGFLGNNILPLRLGEIVRVVAFCKKFNAHKSAVFSTLILERIFDIFSILIMLIIGISLTPSIPDWCKNVGFGMGIMALSLSVLLAIYVKWFDEIVAIFKKYFSFLPEKIFNLISNQIEKSVHGLHTLKDTRILMINILLSALEWLAMCAIIHLSLIAFEVYVPFSVSFIVNGVTSFGVAIPSSPGFFGIIEAVFSKTLALFGVSSINAISAAIYFHLSVYISVNIVGFYYLHKMGLKLADVSEEAEVDAQELEAE